jgi:hypothetical protein
MSEVFMDYLTPLLMAKIVQRRMIGWLVNNELETLKEAAVAKFKVLSQYLSGETWKTSAQISGFWTDICTRDNFTVGCVNESKNLKGFQTRLSYS